MKKPKPKTTKVLFTYADSPSTLVRKAAALEKAGNKREAKVMRDRAARLRREARSAKAPDPVLEARAPRERNSITKTLKGIVKAAEISAAQSMNEAMFGDGRAMRAVSVDHTPLANAPGHGEIVGGYLAQKANVIAKLAGKKGGTDAIQAQLRAMQITTRAEAHWDAEQRERKAVQAVREEMRDKFVCGFIARFDASEAVNTVPSACIMSGNEIRNIIGAPKASGYHADGKR